ncbi:hypothetical protein ACH5RR_027644 [Cinchona calisaya]|uniref:Knottins-like domain-containing protein n=1 Tax=Cinchona calisaya TaxID=153742 RepID=A0ABD2YLI8_9GENT
MEMNKSSSIILLVLLLLLASYHDDDGVGVGLVWRVMGRTCESQSHHFKGACVSNHNCGLVCKNEGFTDGWCRGFRRRCFCTRRC